MIAFNINCAFTFIWVLLLVQSFVNARDDSVGIPRYIQKLNNATYVLISEYNDMCTDLNGNLRSGVNLAGYSALTGSKMWYTVLCDGLQTDDIYFAKAGFYDQSGYIAVGVYRNQSRTGQMHVVSVTNASATVFLFKVPLAAISPGVPIRTDVANPTNSSIAFGVFTAFESTITRTLGNNNYTPVSQVAFSAVDRTQRIAQLSAIDNNIAYVSFSTTIGNSSAVDDNDTVPLFPNSDDSSGSPANKTTATPTAHPSTGKNSSADYGFKLSSAKNVENSTSVYSQSTVDYSNRTSRVLSLGLVPVLDPESIQKINVTLDGAFSELAPLRNSKMVLNQSGVPDVSLDSIVQCGGSINYFFTNEHGDTKYSLISASRYNFSETSIVSSYGLLNNSLNVLSIACLDAQDVYSESATNFSGTYLVFLVYNKVEQGVFSVMTYSVDRNELSNSCSLDATVAFARGNTTSSVKPLSIISSGDKNNLALVTLGSNLLVKVIPLAGSTIVDCLEGRNSMLQPCMPLPDGTCQFGNPALNAVRNTDTPATQISTAALIGAVVGGLGAVVVLGIAVTIFVKKHYQTSRLDPFIIDDDQSSMYSSHKQTPSQQVTPKRGRQPRTANCFPNNSDIIDSDVALERPPHSFLFSGSFLERQNSQTSPLWSHTDLSGVQTCRTSQDSAASNSRSTKITTLPLPISMCFPPYESSSALVSPPFPAHVNTTKRR